MTPKNILIIFNAVENYDCFINSNKSSRIINIMSFRASNFPCTIGIVAESEQHLFSLLNETLAPLDKNKVLIIGNMPMTFLQSNEQPIAEMCVSGAFTLSNPFDPIILPRTDPCFTEQTLDTREADLPPIYNIAPSSLSKGSRSVFPFEILRTRDLHNGIGSLLIDRIIHLACCNAICEIFEHGSRDKLGILPASLLLKGGDINTRRYLNCKDFHNNIYPISAESIRFFLRKHNDGFTYENILRIIRGFSLAAELKKTASASNRFFQITESVNLNAHQKARQFELEVISQAP